MRYSKFSFSCFEHFGESDEDCVIVTHGCKFCAVFFGPPCIWKIDVFF